MQDEMDLLETSISNLVTAPKSTNFEDLYKNWGKLGNQEERRQELLDVQKCNRGNKVDAFRGILDLIKIEEEKDIFKSNRKTTYRPSIYVAGFHKTSHTYKNVLMLSEWMVEKPENFSQDWYVVPCPKGVRMLVVANGGTTKFYNKYGHYKYQCSTALPGGYRSNIKNNGSCVLDCFYCEKNNTAYILDLLLWKYQPMTDGETEFRQYWLKCKFDELGSSLGTISKRNTVIFSILPMIPCTNELLTETLSKYPFFENDLPPIDGLLFYHRRAHYFGGETPLVGWLFPFMVPEIIGEDIKIHRWYADKKPDDYVDQADYIRKFEEKQLRRKNRSANSSMEVETVKDEVKNTDDTIDAEEVKKVDNIECTAMTDTS